MLDLGALHTWPATTSYYQLLYYYRTVQYGTVGSAGEATSKQCSEYADAACRMQQDVICKRQLVSVRLRRLIDPSRPWTRQVSLPAGQIVSPARLTTVASQTRSKEAPDWPPMRGGRCMWRQHLFCFWSRMDARWQEVWPRHENKSRERCDSRASSPHLSIFS